MSFPRDRPDSPGAGPRGRTTRVGPRRGGAARRRRRPPTASSQPSQRAGMGGRDTPPGSAGPAHPGSGRADFPGRAGARSVLAWTGHTEIVGLFGVILGGYDRSAVDVVLARLEDVQTWTDPTKRTALRRELNGIRFPIRMRGYDRAQVDDFLGRMATALDMAVMDGSQAHGAPMAAADTLAALAPSFTVVLRGYDKAEVDASVARANKALVSKDAAQRTSALRELNGARFRTRLWGYDRVQVDDFLRRTAAVLALPDPGDG
jgi:DivIVA domain-containing protein